MYNSEATIELCVKKLLALDYPSEYLEIIIVDNQSTDNSCEIAKAYPVTVVESSGSTIAAVRNDGARYAKGDIFGFVDSDCLVHKAWIKNALVHLNDPVIAATGSGHLCPEDYSWVEKAWLYESQHEPFEVEFIPSGNFFVKAQVFNEIGGFNINLTTCEDADICERIANKGYQIINSSDLMIVHLENPKTIFAFFKKELWYGKSMVSATNRNIDKTMLMTLFFLFAHIGLFCGILNMLLTKNSTVIIFSFVIIVLLCSSSALYRVKRSKKYSFLVHLFCLYYFYLLARSIGVVTSIIRWVKRFFLKCTCRNP